MTKQIPTNLDQTTTMVTNRVVGTFEVVSLFSGCGGMDLGFLGGFEFGGHYYDTLPFTITWANDLNAAACKTYERNLGHPILQGDICEVMDILPNSADVVIGGFPCQDVSVNGSMQGASGKRTILYREMIKVIRKVQPPVFVAENVKGLQQAHGREFFGRMLADFDLPGYKVEP